MKKQAYGFPNNPIYVAEQIRDLIHVMIGRMSPESQQKASLNLRGKFNELNIVDIANKKQPGGSSIGTSIGLVKNILNGRDPYFIKMVIDELTKRL